MGQQFYMVDIFYLVGILTYDCVTILDNTVFLWDFSAWEDEP